MKSTSAIILASSITSTAAFTSNTPSCFVNKKINSSSTARYGLFDGVKDAFGAPALERSTLNSERETPIDRWMGWNVDPVSAVETADTIKDASDFVDSMDEANYVSVSLSKPMGIVFEENDEEFSGIFALSLKEGGIAETDGTIKPGDQLVAVNDKSVTGLEFDDALGAIVDSDLEKTKLIFFRGSSKQLYGPTGASKDWLSELVAKGGPVASS